MKRAAWGGALVALTCGFACALPSYDEYARPRVVTDAGDASPPDASTDDAASNDAATDAGAPRSCAELLARDASAKSGFFTIAHGEVYCDMTTAGGGWTLIARSSGDDGNGDFGWLRKRGDSVRENHKPYSLAVLGLDLPFTQVIVGSRDDDGYAWVNAYVLDVTRAALLDAAEKNLPVTKVTPVVGDCTPSEGPSMLFNVGFTKTRDHFHFRDVDGLADPDGATYGFFDNHFDTRYANCNQGGKLDGTDGMIMVR